MPKEKVETVIKSSSLGRIGKPEEVAQAVLFLASEHSTILPVKLSWWTEELFSRLLKNDRQSRASRDFPHPSSLRRTSKYASFLRISGALHPGILKQPLK